MSDIESPEMKLIAMQIVNEFKKQLPCEAIQRKVHKLDTVVNDGLKDDVKDINGKLDTHIKQHQKAEEEKVKGKRDFYRGVKLTLISACIGGLFAVMAVIISKLLGG